MREEKKAERMSHLLLLTYGPPEQHERFRKLINKQKYMLKNKPRRGWYRPFASEIKLWSVHIPDEIVDDFIDDLKPQTGSSSSNIKKHLGIIDKFIDLIAKITPLKRVKKCSTPAPASKLLHKMNGWYYVRPLGKFPDPKDKKGNELL